MVKFTKGRRDIITVMVLYVQTCTLQAGVKPGSPDHTVFEHCVVDFNRSATTAGLNFGVKAL